MKILEGVIVGEQQKQISIICEDALNCALEIHNVGFQILNENAQRSIRVEFLYEGMLVQNERVIKEKALERVRGGKRKIGLWVQEGLRLILQDDGTWATGSGWWGWQNCWNSVRKQSEDLELNVRRNFRRRERDACTLLCTYPGRRRSMLKKYVMQNFTHKYKTLISTFFSIYLPLSRGNYC